MIPAKTDPTPSQTMLLRPSQLEKGKIEPLLARGNFDDLA